MTLLAYHLPYAVLVYGYWLNQLVAYNGHILSDTRDQS
jgi:hypothetical protein